MGVINDIAKIFIQYVDLKARQYTSDALEESRRVITGALLFLAGGLFWGMGAFFLFAGLFFRIADTLNAFARPAVYTGTASLVIALFISAVAYRTMGRKDHGEAQRRREGDGSVRRVI